MVKTKPEELSNFIQDVATFMTAFNQVKRKWDKWFKDMDKRMEKVETKYLELDDDELEPDIPAVLGVIDGILQEYKELEDIDDISIHYLYNNQVTILDALKNLLIYVVMKGFAVDLMDNQVARLTTMTEAIEEMKEKSEEKAKASYTQYT